MDIAEFSDDSDHHADTKHESDDFWGGDAIDEDDDKNDKKDKTDNLENLSESDSDSDSSSTSDSEPNPEPFEDDSRGKDFEILVCFVE